RGARWPWTGRRPAWGSTPRTSCVSCSATTTSGSGPCVTRACCELRASSRAVSGTRPAPFAAFRSGNFSRYFTGQLVSNVGLWFQNLALSLVVLEITGSAQALALVTVAQFGPITLFGGLAGRVVDAVSARTVLLVTCVA